MFVYSVVLIVTVILAYQVKSAPSVDGHCGTYPHGISRQHAINTVVMAAIFMMLFLTGALRLEVGNDYGTYVVTAHEIFQRGYVVTEAGYNLLVRILYTLSGKEDYLLLFAVFAAAIPAVFLKVFKDQSDSFVMSFYMFMTMGIYFRTFNTVRYYFALAIAMYSLRYIAGKDAFCRENIIKFLLLIVFAALFHKSVLIVIPMYILARLPWSKWIYIGIGIVAMVLPIFSTQVMKLALRLYPSYRDTVYIEEHHTVWENLPVVMGCVAIVLICLVCYGDSVKNRPDNKMYFHMNLMAIALYVGCYFLPLVTRFGYYLVTPQLLLLPNVICSVKDTDKRRRLTLLVGAACMIYLAYFLHTADRIGVRVLPYKSFLFYDHYWLNQTDTF